MTTTTTTTTDLSLQFSALVAAANAGRVATSTLLAAAKDVGDAIEDLVPVGLRLDLIRFRGRFDVRSLLLAGRSR